MQLIDDPIFIALLATICLSLANQLQFIGLETADYVWGSVVITASSCVAFWCVAPFILENWFWTTWAALLFAAVGVFRPAFTVLLALRSNVIIGPTLTAALAATAPVFAGLASVFIFEEVLTVQSIAGTALVMLGVALLTLGRNKVSKHWRWYAILLPLGVALLRAASHAVTKLGLTELPSPLFASLVGSTVSLAVVLLVSAAGPVKPKPDWSTNKYFFASGLLSAAAIYFFNVALVKGSLLIVVPIATTVPVFTLIIGRIFFQREHFNSAAVLSVGFVVLGTITLALRQ